MYQPEEVVEVFHPVEVHLVEVVEAMEVQLQEYLLEVQEIHLLQVQHKVIVVVTLQENHQVKLEELVVEVEL